jgi:hypothetical protein
MFIARSYVTWIVELESARIWKLGPRVRVRKPRIREQSRLYPWRYKLVPERGTNDHAFVCVPSIPLSQDSSPFGSQSSRPGFCYPLHTAMLQGQTSPTHVVPITPNVPPPLTLQRISCNAPKTHYEDQSASRNIPRQVRKVGYRPTTETLPRCSAAPSNTRGVRKKSYSCETCDKEFAQPQSLSRHRWERHGPELCIYCGAFKWARRYLLKAHLIKMHPDLDTDLALDEAVGARHGAAVAKAPDTPIGSYYRDRKSL